MSLFVPAAADHALDLTACLLNHHAFKIMAINSLKR